ncbi:MAG: hypothetical protein DRJ40_02380 [Thermoprotei archaeon]|nr:MAG: hypothetical protein DRJ40_02380 [Thermoprotei archaeon]
MSEKPRSVKLTVLVDYRARHSRLRTEFRGSTHPGAVGLALFLDLEYDSCSEYVLVDTSRDWRNLTHNASVLDVDLSKVSTIVITHWHIDHYGALPKLVTSICPGARVYGPILTSRAGEVLRRQGISSREVVTRIKGSTELMPGFFVLRPLLTDEPNLLEIPILIELSSGTTVLITGCFHYNVEDLRGVVSQVLGRDEVTYLIGGLHLVYGTPEIAKQKVLKLREFTGAICPLHCSGDVGIEVCRKVFGSKVIELLCGDTLSIGD